jgi:hypothetical protein|tara:strand:+ start:2479 stop:3426 length:948 start_codon:yes stop_codon:yes gene_type:complete
MAKKKIPAIVNLVRNYNPEPINHAFQKNVSFSQLSMFRQCPKKWSLQYKEGHKQYTPTIHTVFGTALHEAVQHYLTIMYDVSAAAADREDIIGLFEEKLSEEYRVQYKKNGGSHFSDAIQLREFFNDGINIITHLMKNRGKYFSKRGTYLAGIEVPILITPNKRYTNVIYQGYLDVVLYNENTNKFDIIDIKTSTSGWSKWAKKDEDKQFQLILYKKFFSETFNVPLENINIEFFIVKRKLYESEDYVIPRIQRFIPASGKVKLNKATNALNEFITKAFTRDGYAEVEHITTPNNPNNNCNWCAYHKTHLCPATF